ncbi:HAD-IA family hydrolase [Saccharibacillus qingshengii]|uniref:HAD-IA family hydrolase n=1 Tax=Saccharibacillus qingshengii TaxID=1763540 RepID=UPI001552886A|nr:HAD-IA family hydrolase [Saccharibacillus qingshengii]
MIRHIIFDFDGTIVHSRPLISKIYNRAAQKHGYRPIREDDQGPFAGHSITQRRKALGIPLYRMPALGLNVVLGYHRGIENLEVKPGIGELIDQLHEKGYPLSIISSNLERNIRAFLQNKGIDHFEQIRSARSLFGKHRAIRSFLKRNDLKAEEVLYIGDELRDIKAGRRTGVHVVSAAWGYDSLESMRRISPDFTVSRPTEVLTAIQRFDAMTT